MTGSELKEVLQKVLANDKESHTNLETAQSMLMMIDSMDRSMKKTLNRCKELSAKGDTATAITLQVGSEQRIHGATDAMVNIAMTLFSSYMPKEDQHGRE